MTDHELFQQALDDLLHVSDGLECLETIKLLTARVAQPEPEPVATQYKYIDAHGKDYWTSEQWEGKKVEAVRYLYAAPQREWVGLTDEGIRQSYETTGHCQTLRPQDSFAVYALARAIEAKLKKENDF